MEEANEKLAFSNGRIRVSRSSLVSTWNSCVKCTATLFRETAVCTHCMNTTVCSTEEEENKAKIFSINLGTQDPINSMLINGGRVRKGISSSMLDSHLCIHVDSYLFFLINHM